MRSSASHSKQDDFEGIRCCHPSNIPVRLGKNKKYLLTDNTTLRSLTNQIDQIGQKRSAQKLQPLPWDDFLFFDVSVTVILASALSSAASVRQLSQR